MLGTLEVLETLGEVWSNLDRQSHEKGPQSGFLGPDEFPPIQVGFESLSAAPDGAERANQVLLAEPRTVELDLIHSPVMPEYKVIAAVAQALKLPFQRLRPVGASDIIGNVERLSSCFTVPIDPPRVRLDTIRNPVLFQQFGVFTFRVRSSSSNHEPLSSKTGIQGATDHPSAA